MDKLRRSFRDSFRRRREQQPAEATRALQWQADESAVRAGTCTFQVKYLGCVEVYEARGIQVCEEALKVLKNSRRRPVRALLHVSGDGLRVVEDETRGLIVDQTIEKVSFCAPDRNNERGFSYICRDGTTRRWMCHGFLVLKESGERLSHAVGCAFAVCLERKQQRDKECNVTMTFDQRTSTFTRSGSFRQPSLTERLQDSRERAIDVVPVRQVYNPFAIERPHATPSMLERQGSFRGFNQLNQASPFKRQLSLRVNDLPSNFERVRSHSLEPTDLARLPQTLPHQIPPRPAVSPIPEISPSGQDSVSVMCQQLSRGLSLLSSTDDYNPAVNTTTSTVVKKLFSNTATSTAFPGVASSNSLDDLKLQNGQSLLDALGTSGMMNNNSTSGITNINNNSTANNINCLNSINATDEQLSGIGLGLGSGSVVGGGGSDGMSWHDSGSSSMASSSTTNNPRLTPILNQCSLSPVLTPRIPPIPSVFETPAASPAFSNASTSSLSSGPATLQSALTNRSPVPTSTASQSSSAFVSSGVTLGRDSPVLSSSPPAIPNTTPATSAAVTDTPAIASAFAPSTQAVQPSSSALPKPDQWLGSVTTQATTSVAPAPGPIPPVVAPRRAPPLHARAMSLGSANVPTPTARVTTSTTATADPFDAEWADIAARNLSRQSSTTNPFIMPNTTQAFQVCC
ncbi:hypothetical protein QAD02_001082 [Eretmocerus hayati]|uniref:Uncharacterized protein n=1 Tax=Eretmocerus hayati TaxID=131215 RepID=A0ACC2NFX4_9HYME|nr:hypothetical protein QAD02_001082 [Eretmocerus hayati]